MRLLRHRPLAVLAAASTLAFTCLALAASPGALSAPDGSSVIAPVRIAEVRVDGSSSRRAAPRRAVVVLPVRANLVGARWHGAGSSIALRTRTAGGVWSAWATLESGEDAPDPGSAEGRASRARAPHVAGAPAWVGAADEVQVRAGSGVRSLRLVAINVEGTSSVAERRRRALRRAAGAVAGVVRTDAAHAVALAPGIRSRTAWSAQPARTSPAIAPAAAGVVVHHTASTNRYSCAQVPAVLRGIQRYHVRSNGWNDIGYNFLIDRCGGVWEGRGGGVRRAVVGAHTSGFNTATVGIALIGSHGSTGPSAAARTALRRLVAWRLDVAHVNPTGRTALVARSSDRFTLGSRVVVRAVSGHRDLFPTGCPGAIAYGSLPALARSAWLSGGLKLANLTTAPTFDEATGQLTRVRLRITTGPRRDAVATLALVRSSTGQELASASSAGPVHVLDASAALAGVPVWDVRVRASATDAEGRRARPLDVPLLAVGADPGFGVVEPPRETVRPGGPDATDDAPSVTFTLASAARVGAWLHDPATGDQLAVLVPPTQRAATPQPLRLEVPLPAQLADGRYELRVGVVDDPAPGRSVRRFALTVTRDA